MARLQRARARLGSSPARLMAAPKVAGPVYRSAEWRALVAQVIAKRGRRCERAGCSHGGRVYADHVVELRDGGAPFDESNIELLCAVHHGAKTEAEKRKRAGLG